MLHFMLWNDSIVAIQFMKKIIIIFGSEKPNEVTFYF